MTNMPVTATERMLLGKPGVSTRDTTGSAAGSSAGREVMSDQISPPIHSRPGGQLPGRLTPSPGEGSGRRGLTRPERSGLMRRTDESSHAEEEPAQPQRAAAEDADLAAGAGAPAGSWPAGTGAGRRHRHQPAAAPWRSFPCR